MKSRPNQFAARQKSATKSQTTLSLARFCFQIATAIVLSGYALPVSAQELSENRVEQLLKLLDAEGLAQRNDAEAELLKLGLPLDDWLENEPQIPFTSSEASFRLRRIRAKLFDVRVRDSTTASFVRLGRGLTAAEVQSAIADQTANTVMLECGEIEAALEGSFWEVIDELCRRFNLTIDYAGSDDFQLKLTETSSQGPGHLKKVAQGLLRVERLANADTASRQLRLRILWEPRLRIETLRIPMADLQLLDENGDAWATFNRNAIYSIPPAGSRTNTTLRLPVNPTSTRKLKMLVMPVELNVIAPAGRCQFENVSRLRSGGQSRQFGMASITLERIERVDGRVTLQLSTRYDADRMAQPLQSHSEWSRFCSAELISEGGKKVKPVEMRQVRQEPYRFVIEFTFQLPDPAARWDLDFRIPSGIVGVRELVEMEMSAE